MTAFTLPLFILIGIAVILLLIALSMPTAGKTLIKDPPLHYTATLKVDFEKCYLLETTLEKEIYQPNIMAPEKSLFDPKLQDQDTQRHKFSTTIVFEQEGHKFYRTVEKDRVTMQYYMMVKKETTIYYDPNNPQNYFFDLRFINE